MNQGLLRLAPLVPVPSVGVAYTLHENRRVWINPPSSRDSLGLCSLVIADSFGPRPPNRIIALFRSLLDEQFTALTKSTKLSNLAALAPAPAVHALIATAVAHHDGTTDVATGASPISICLELRRGPAHRLLDGLR